MKYNLISSSVGLFLKEIRKEKNITGKQLAKLINISQQQISRYETGASSLSLDQLNEILIVLDKRWIELVDYIDNVSEKTKEKDTKSKKYLHSIKDSTNQIFK